MALTDLKIISEDFDAERERVAKKVVAMIDKRLAILKKIVPGVTYIDGMGTSFLKDNDASRDEDPAYLAMDVVLEGKSISTEEQWGEPLPEYMVKAKMLAEKHSDVITEIFDIGNYLTDTLGYTYSS